MNEKLVEKSDVIFYGVLIIMVILCSILAYFTLFNQSYSYPEDTYLQLQNIVYDSFDVTQKTINFKTELPEDVKLTINTDDSYNLVLNIKKEFSSTLYPDLNYSLKLSKDNFKILSEGRDYPSFEEYHHQVQLTRVLCSVLVGALFSLLLDIIIVFIILHLKKVKHSRRSV